MVERRTNAMVKIGVYPPRKQTLYIDALKQSEYNFFLLNKEELVAKSVLDVIIFDYTDQVKKDLISEICELLCIIKSGEIPFVFVLLKESSSVERLIYLQLGATIVFDAQVNPEEFEVILSNLLQVRKNQKNKLPSMQNGFQLNEQNLSVSIDNEPEISLTPLEFKLINYLKSRTGGRVTYDELCLLLWSETTESHQYRLANLVFRIRNKIEKNNTKPRYLKTIRSIGYALFL